MDDVRIPPRHNKLNVNAVERLIKAAWYEDFEQPADKFIVLVDTDGKTPEDTLSSLQDQLPSRLGDDEITRRVQYGYAQWHLEAWFFADATNLRSHLGRSLGSIDTSRPDEIQSPKSHLKNLLGHQICTARVSEEISMVVDARTIFQRSPSFRLFIEAVMNGESSD